MVPFAKLTDSALLSLSELERRRKEGIRVELCSREGEGVGRPDRGSSWLRFSHKKRFGKGKPDIPAPCAPR